MLKLSQVHDVPKTCRLASGLLLNVVTGYYEMRATQHRFSSTVLGLKFAVDETNGLQKLHEFMTRLYFGGDYRIRQSIPTPKIRELIIFN